MTTPAPVLPAQVADSATAAVAAAQATAASAGLTLTQGAVDLDTPFRVASLTKVVTALTAHRACAATGTDLDTPVRDVLPSHVDPYDGPGRGGAHPEITVRHVLSQTSGLRPTVTGADIAELGDGPDVLPAAAQLVLAAGSIRPPGAAFEYYNGNYFIVGAVIAALTGTTYEDAVQDLVLDPLELSGTTFTPDTNLPRGREDGVELPAMPYPRGRRPSGGLVSTAGDLLRLGSGILTDQALMAELSTSDTAADDPVKYSSGWALGPSGQMFLNGRLPGYRAVMLLVPDHGLVACALANATEALPGLAACIDGVQEPLTGDDLAAALEDFAL